MEKVEVDFGVTNVFVHIQVPEMAPAMRRMFGIGNSEDTIRIGLSMEEAHSLFEQLKRGFEK